MGAGLGAARAGTQGVPGADQFSVTALDGHGRDVTNRCLMNCCCRALRSIRSSNHHELNGMERIEEAMIIHIDGVVPGGSGVIDT